MLPVFVVQIFAYSVILVVLSLQCFILFPFYYETLWWAWLRYFIISCLCCQVSTAANAILPKVVDTHTRCYVVALGVHFLLKHGSHCCCVHFNLDGGFVREWYLHAMWFKPMYCVVILLIVFSHWARMYLLVCEHPLACTAYGFFALLVKRWLGKTKVLRVWAWGEIINTYHNSQSVYGSVSIACVTQQLTCTSNLLSLNPGHALHCFSSKA